MFGNIYGIDLDTYEIKVFDKKQDKICRERDVIAIKNKKNIFSRTGIMSVGVRGVSGGVWECGKPERFSIISMPQSEGEKGEVTFSLRPRRGRSLAPPFPPMGLQNVRKEV